MRLREYRRDDDRVGIAFNLRLNSFHREFLQQAATAVHLNKSQYLRSLLEREMEQAEAKKK